MYLYCVTSLAPRKLSFFDSLLIIHRFIVYHLICCLSAANFQATLPSGVQLSCSENGYTFYYQSMLDLVFGETVRDWATHPALQRLLQTLYVILGMWSQGWNYSQCMQNKHFIPCSLYSPLIFFYFGATLGSTWGLLLALYQKLL